jgi:hypothetical protein
MESLVKGCAALGMLWTVALALFGLILGLSQGVGMDMKFLFLCALMFVIWGRFFQLYRGAGLLTCGYCWWMVLTSGSAGIGLWTTGWTLAALLVTAVVMLSWSRLKNGI